MCSPSCHSTWSVNRRTEVVPLLLMPVFVVGCSLIVPEIEFIHCQADLDCYALSSDKPFDCWICDRSRMGGTCIPALTVEPAQTLDITGPPVARMNAFTAAGKVTLVAEQDPVPGSSVTASVAAQLRSDFTLAPLPLFGGDSVISQLAVAADADLDWCLGVDHQGDRDGHLCLGRCDDSACPRLCSECSGARRPSLAIRRCRTPGGSCETLSAYLDQRSARVAALWSAVDGRAQPVSLPETLDPACPPVVLRVEREDKTHFVIASAQRGHDTPWLGLIDADNAGRPELVEPQTEQTDVGGARVSALAGAAAEGSDANGEFLLAWVVADAGQYRLFATHNAWLGDDRVRLLRPVVERPLNAESVVTVAFARFGIRAVSSPGPGGWSITFRDGGQAMALRIDRAVDAQRAVQPEHMKSAGHEDFLVAANPAGRESTAPFVYIDRAEGRARFYGCKQ